MHRIYRHASKVWIWLGNSQQYTEAAIELLPQLAKLGENPPARWSHLTSSFVEARLPDQESPIWGAIQDILCNKWFTRVWTVQEFILAQQVSFLCGLYEIDSEQVMDILIHAPRLEGLQDSNKQIIPLAGISRNVGMARIRELVPPTREIYAAKSSQPRPADLVGIVCEMTKDHKCQCRKDRVWGILGLLEEDHGAEMQLKDDMSVCELYTTFAQYMFNHADRTENSFWQLVDRGTLDGKITGLPSWCPDYNLQVNERTRNSISQLRSRGQRPYSASSTSSFVRRGKSPSQLLMKATLFDTIQRIYPPTPLPQKSIRSFSIQHLDPASMDDIGERVFEIRQLITKLKDELLFNRALPDAGQDGTTDGLRQERREDFWRTLIGGICLQSDYETTEQTFSGFLAAIDQFLALPYSYESYREGCTSGTLSNGPGSDGRKEVEEARQRLFNPKTSFVQFLGPLWMCLQNRRLFETTQGRLGFGSMHIAKGDNVCIISGSSTAHVLRTIDHSCQEQFRFLGEAYVHGMMTGEIDTLGLKEQCITLE